MTRAALASPDNHVFVSAATAWEISIKQALGRLKFPLDRFDEILQRIGFSAMPIHPGQAIAAGCLPRLHNDPFDRMLIAQALTEGLTLVSQDRVIARYEVPILMPAA
jgi:PIN domain nuclease of toxin-antitoxin system